MSKEFSYYRSFSLSRNINILRAWTDLKVQSKIWPLWKKKKKKTKRTDLMTKTGLADSWHTWCILATNFPDITLSLHVHLTCRQDFDISLSIFIYHFFQPRRGIYGAFRQICSFFNLSFNKAYSQAMAWRPTRWSFNVVTQFSASWKIWGNVPKKNYYMSALWIKSLLKAIHLIQEEFTLR